MTLHIKVHGTGASLVFFHGWGFDHTIWLSLVPLLASQFKLHLVDLPGFGLSPLMNWDEFRQNLMNRLPEEFKVVGWSMGGLFAMQLAIEEPKRVKQLVAVASSPYFIKDKQWPGIEKQIFADFFQDFINNPQGALTEFVNLQLQNTLYHYKKENLPDIMGLNAGLEILVEWDLRERLGFLVQPSCFMFGHYDAIVPRSTMTIMQKRHPHFDYVMFKKSSHIPFLSHQSEFITKLQDFLL